MSVVVALAAWLGACILLVLVLLDRPLTVIFFDEAVLP